MSDSEQAKRALDYEISRGRGCLVSREAAHVDSETGLLVAQLAGGVGCGGEPLIYAAPCAWSRDFVDGWNTEARRRFAAGERVGPRFLDRVTTLDALRERFQRDGASAVALSSDEEVAFGDHEARWYFTVVVVRPRGAVDWLQPAGGRPPGDSGLADPAVSALPADGGRTLWARATTKAGAEVRYFVVDLETGTNFQILDASVR
jgi:hypothetical protein